MSALTFDPVGHVYTLGGVVVPSVTQVLGALDDWPGIPAAILEAARYRGQRVHEACALELLGVLDEATVDDEVAPYLAQFRRFLAESRFQAILSEHQVWSSKLGYAGTLDLFGDLPRAKSALIDIKSGTRPKAVGPQTAAYARALRESAGMTAKSRWCLLLTPTKSTLHELADPNDDRVFLAALTINHWRKSK